MIGLAHNQSEVGLTDKGFWITEGVLSASDCKNLIPCLSGAGKRGRAGIRHLMTNPAVTAVAWDFRLLEIAKRGLGGKAVPFRATLFEKSGRSNWLVMWHQDTALSLEAHVASADWGPWSRKAGILYAHAPTWALNRVLALRIHLDASTSENGPLRVVPGSHKAGVLTDEQVFQMAGNSEWVECLGSPGSVLAMRPLVIHSSSKVIRDQLRRVLHIEYADSLELATGIRLAIA